MVASSTVLQGATLAACVAASAAFAPAPLGGLAHRSLGPHAGIAARAPRGLALRMQEQDRAQAVAAAIPVDQEAPKVPAMDGDISVARTERRSPSVKTETEVNFYARTANRLGWLKQTSPLMTSDLPGNKGFDPLGFAKRNDLLLQYREAELKHARLAMLASVGWAVSELLHPNLVKLTGAQSLLQPGASGTLEKAPSVLNGGLEAVNPAIWAMLLLVTAVIEAGRMIIVAENPSSFKPGDLGFDPLGVYREADDQERRSLELKEINNGRLAMIAIAVFALQEFLGNGAIVNLAPQFFTAGPLANVGSVGDLILQYTGLLSCQSGLVYCAEGQGALGALLQEDNGATAEYLMEVLGN